MWTEAKLIPCLSVNTGIKQKCFSCFSRKYLLQGDKTEPMKQITCQDWYLAHQEPYQEVPSAVLTSPEALHYQFFQILINFPSYKTCLIILLIHLFWDVIKILS